MATEQPSLQNKSSAPTDTLEREEKSWDSPHNNTTPPFIHNLLSPLWHFPRETIYFLGPDNISLLALKYPLYPSQGTEPWG